MILRGIIVRSFEANNPIQSTVFSPYANDAIHNVQVSLKTHTNYVKQPTGTIILWRFEKEKGNQGDIDST